MTDPRLLFALICLVWGTSWMASKIGVTAAPPLLFAGARFLLAVPLLFLLARKVTPQSPTPADRPIGRALLAGLVGIAAANALIFWGLARAPSGVAGLINLSLIPIGLYAFGRIAGVEPASRRKLAALAIGVIGLGLLMAPGHGTIDADPLGLAAITIGTLLVAVGAIAGRPLAVAWGPFRVNAWTSLIGGVGLLALSLALEPVFDSLPAFARPDVALALAYLVLAGSVAAYTAYWRLLDVWGPARTGSYAFISPLIALGVGAIMLNEAFGWREAVSAGILLFAARLALSSPAVPDRKSET